MRVHPERNTTPADYVRLPEVLPKTGVATFVEGLVRRAGVAVVRTRLDEVAEAVTRMTGDEVRLDAVGQALVALKARNVLTGEQMNKSFINHVRERRGG